MANYVQPEDLRQEIEKYQKTCKFHENGKIKKRGKVTPELGKMIQSIAEGLAKKPNWSGYTWKEDMISEAKLMILLYMHNYKPEKMKNPFSYLNKFCENAFKQYIHKQKNHSEIKQNLYDKKDILLEDAGDESLNYEVFANKNK